MKTKYATRARQEAPEGIDLGLSALATFADGTKVEAPKPLRRAQQRLRRLEREKSRRQKDSKNRAKTCAKPARVHENVANQRVGATHKLTMDLATTRTSIVIGDLCVQGMAKNHSLVLGVHDAAFGEFCRQLEYKCAWYGCGLELADRCFPSTQTCSACGLLKEGDEKLDLSKRTFRCAGCGLAMDRDENAARVLASLAGSEETRKLVARSCRETENACGAASADWAPNGPVKLAAQAPTSWEGSRNQDVKSQGLSGLNGA